MTGEELPAIPFGNAVKMTLLDGRTLYGAFQRTYTPDKGDTLITLRTAGQLQSFGLASIKSVEVMP